MCLGKEVYVSGNRALDMAVRLQYAGVTVKKDCVRSDLKGLLNSISFKNNIVFPNYSAMLDTRKILVGRRIL